MVSQSLQHTTYCLSAPNHTHLPTDSLAEVAFAGRSNAGKSSAINAIMGRTRLAHTSKTPGRTQSLNCYRVQPERYIVDLPGYGYAKVAKSQQLQWRPMITDYLLSRKNLNGIILMMDCRHPCTENDHQLLGFCQHHKLPIYVLLTKADKLSRQQQNKQARIIAEELPRESWQLFSARTKQGLEQAQLRLCSWLDLSLKD